MEAIERIETRISPDFLDITGRSFRFRHGKGIAEWLKNSLDQYLLRHILGDEPLTGNWPVYVNLINARRASMGPNLAVVDFGGTTYDKVHDFFLHWGDTTAATHGGAVTSSRLTGGHGNGGKFYMREMWKDGARFITWRGGLATSLVVENVGDGTTGYWEHKGIALSWRQALEFAFNPEENLGGSKWLFEYLRTEESEIKTALDRQERGFTAVVGRRGKQILSSNDVVRGGRWVEQDLIDDIRSAQQARRPIRELQISVFIDGHLRLSDLHPETVEADEDWAVLKVEAPIEIFEGNDLASGATAIGHLALKKAASPLRGRSRYQNAIYVVDGNDNPIASYPISELPLPGHSSLSEFLYGELRLVFPSVHYIVETDRERLVQGPATQRILGWVAEQIWIRRRQAEKEQRAAQRKSELDVASALNNLLNEHARRFLRELETAIMIDFLDDPIGGGEGDDDIGTGPVGDKPTIAVGVGEGGSGGGSGPERPGPDGREDTPGQAEQPGNKKSVRRPRFPLVLLSGRDVDPARADGELRHLTDRHPPLYQSDEDREYNIWWLNTTHPFAGQSLQRGGSEGPWFKSYHLFMFQQMIQLESLRLLQRREAELALDTIEGELMKYANDFLSALPMDLVDALLGHRSN